MPELRKDPVVGRWVIVSTARGKRPSDFLPSPVDDAGPQKCPFCYGHEHMTPPEITAYRPDGSRPNTPGWKVRTVPNKYPALGIDDILTKRGVGIYDMMTGFGAHEVIIETPDHYRGIKDLTLEELSDVLRMCQGRIQDLHRDIRFRYILVFRNEGPLAGASLSHPHTQLVATPITPKRVKEELMGAESYFKQRERCIFCDIIHEEREEGRRIVFENDHFISFCPFASRFPFEIWLLPKRHELDFHASHDNLRDMAQALKVTMQKLAIALNNPQYNYIIHSAPNLFPRRGYWQTIQDDYHWHIEIMPRLTKVAGFEWGTGFYINPTPPEDAAKYLQEVTVAIA
ncbi:MAG: galactose-1-phosphate uridylyltransferase [Candidatus Omnitrophica bacterium]|nr:galactose-1-phosphate uridylyltransferase [Candidatus Omnitrophota bacterium]